jgi:hypothetical protein
MANSVVNVGVYVREVRQVSGEMRKEVFKTHRTEPPSSWGNVTCIHPDVEHLRDGEAMIHALKVVGYYEVPMK